MYNRKLTRKEGNMNRRPKSTLWGVLAPIIGVALLNGIVWSMGEEYEDRILSIPNLVISVLLALSVIATFFLARALFRSIRNKPRKEEV
jgi:hypothetical protein